MPFASLLAIATGAGEARIGARERARAAHRTGRSWEDELVAAWEVVRLVKMGLVVKTAPPVALKKTPTGLAFVAFTAHGGCDFLGSVRDPRGPLLSPIPVYLDAKTAGSKMSFNVVDRAGRDANERARRIRQAEFLVDARRLTPFAGYLVKLTEPEAVVFIHAPDHLAALARGDSVPLRLGRGAKTLTALNPDVAALPWPTSPPWPRSSAIPSTPPGTFPVLDLLFSSLS